MNTPAPTRAQRNETADLVTVIVLGALTTLVVASVTATRLWSAFRPDGFAWSLDVDQTPVEATAASGAAPVQGYAGELLVIDPDVSTATAVAGAASIIVWALTALVIVASVMFLAWSFLRGRFFVRSTARTFTVIGWTLVIGGLVVLGLENVVRNGILASLGVTGEPLHPLAFWNYAPVWLIGVAMGILAVAFRRGIRLQDDSRGLV